MKRERELLVTSFPSSSMLKMYFNDSGAVKIQAVIIQAGRVVGADLRREVLLLLHILF